MRLPYALLIGPLSGFLSLVPYVGVPLAVSPPLIAALPVFSHLSVYIAIAAVIALFPPHRSQPPVSQAGGFEGPSEPAGRYGGIDVLGHLMGRHRPSARHPHHCGTEGGMR